MAAGALGCSISGAGPTMFAWALAAARGGRARRRWSTAFAARTSIETDSWVVDDRSAPGARIVEADLHAIRQHARCARTPSTLSDAIVQGLAPDGGLYVPERLAAHRRSTPCAAQTSCPAIAARLLAPFFAGDRARARSCGRSSPRRSTFPAPLVDARRRRRPLACSSCSTARPRRSRISARASSRRACARCARDAIASAHDPRRDLRRHGRRGGRGLPSAAGIEVVVLFPEGLVSPRRSSSSRAGAATCARFAVRGTFDDCQRLVKEAFRDPTLARALRLSSANSINLGRLLPQMVVLRGDEPRVWRRDGASRHRSSSRAATWATCSPASGRARSGLPIGDIVLAHNANRTVPDFLDTGEWQPRASIATLASAMDVGDPSNMERLRALFPEIARAARRQSRATSVDDDAIRARSARTSRLRAGLVPAHGDRGRRSIVACRRPRDAAAGFWSRPRIRQNSARSSSR